MQNQGYVSSSRFDFYSCTGKEARVPSILLVVLSDVPFEGSKALQTPYLVYPLTRSHRLPPVPSPVSSYSLPKARKNIRAPRPQ